MPVRTDNGFSEEVVIRFVGRDADEGRINLHELATSLEGWDAFLRLSTATLFRGRPSAETTIPGARLDIQARAVRSGSFEVLLLMAVSGVIGNAAWEVVKRLWPFAKNVYQAHLSAKRERMSFEEAAEQLAAAAAYGFDGQPPVERVDEDALEFTKVIDESIAKGTLPVSRSANDVSIVVPGRGPIITVGPGERQLLRLPYNAAEPLRPVGVLERRTIRLLGVNIHNGWGRFHFEDPTGLAESHQQECKVIDQSLREPHNIYTRSLDDRTPIEVWVKLVVRDDSPTHSVYWLIYGPEVPLEDKLF